MRAEDEDDAQAPDRGTERLRVQHRRVAEELRRANNQGECREHRGGELFSQREPGTEADREGQPRRERQDRQHSPDEKTHVLLGAHSATGSFTTQATVRSSLL